MTPVGRNEICMGKKIEKEKLSDDHLQDEILETARANSPGPSLGSKKARARSRPP